MDLFDVARGAFPAAQKMTYVDIASRAPMSDHVRSAIESFLDDRQSGLETKHLWFDKVESVRRKAAKLIGAQADEIAFTKNTSHGISSVISALPWSAGDNIILAPDFEHPNNVYSWLPLRQRGVEIRTLALSGSSVTLEQMEGSIDSRTRAIGIASVSFATGGRTDLDLLGELCLERGIFLIVDGVQSLGVLDLDVRKTPVNALAAATSKSLLGLYGMGILYCRDADLLHPAHLSRFGVDLGDEKEYVQGALDYQLARGARRFELGNFNYLGIHALDASVDHILEIGVPAVEAHVLRLAQALTAGVQKLGYEIASSTEPVASHIVVFRPPAGSPSAAEVSDILRENSVTHSVRRFGLRLSFHLYNNLSDVEHILSVLPAVRRGRAIGCG